MNVVLHLISTSFAQLWGTGNWRKIQNKNICLHLESNLRLLAFQPGALDHLDMLIVINLFLHYSNLWIYSTRLTMPVLNWLWLNVYWNWLSDILFISYTNVDIIHYCSEYLVWANQTLIVHYLIEWQTKSTEGIAFCRCSHALWIASGKIANLSEAIHIYCPANSDKMQFNTYRYIHIFSQQRLSRYGLL